MEAATSTGALGEAMTPELAAEVETVEQVQLFFSIWCFKVEK